jgi:hypothetical protein
MRLRPLTLMACFAACVATCAHPAPPAPSPQTWKAPSCITEPSETAGPPTGATVICEGTSAVSFEDLREAAIFDAARATLAARRTHLVIAREERRTGAPATQCPKPAPDEKLRERIEHMTGGPVETAGRNAPCKPVPGSEGHVLALAVRFLRSHEAAPPGARSAAEVLGMSPPAPASPPHPEPDAGSDGQRSEPPNTGDAGPVDLSSSSSAGG